MRASALGVIFAVCSAATVASTVSSAGASGPKANPVVTKMIAAYGGSAVLDSIKSRVVVVTAPLQNEAANITLTFARPDKLVRVVSIPALHVTVTFGFDGTTGWVRDTAGHIQPMSGNDLADMRCAALDPILSVLQSNASSSISVQSSKATVDGKQYDSLRVSIPGCPVSTMLVDQNTHLIARVSDAEGTTDFSNYEVGAAGERYPKTIAVTSSVDGSTIVSTITSEQVNVTVDDSMFAMPAAGSSPVPVPGLTPVPPPPPPSTATPAASAPPVPAPAPTH